MVNISAKKRKTPVTKNARKSEEEKSPKLLGSVDNFLDNMKLMVNPIANIFGKNCEVVLHDLRDLQRSIVAIANGHVTGRKLGGPVIGGPLDDESLKPLLEQKDTRSILSSYSTRSIYSHRLKSTTIIFRNSKGKPVAALAINLDLSEFDKANELLNEISKTNGEIHQKTTQTEQHESQGDDMATLIRGIIEDAISGMQKPIHLAEKEDKIKAVKTMYERGLFLMKGSVTHVAMALNVSRFTIYNYLKEIGYSE